MLNLHNLENLQLQYSGASFGQPNNQGGQNYLASAQNAADQRAALEVYQNNENENFESRNKEKKRSIIMQYSPLVDRCIQEEEEAKNESQELQQTSLDFQEKGGDFVPWGSSGMNNNNNNNEDDAGSRKSQKS